MKDPAALFYIDTWLSSTAEMDSDVRGWYLNLILHQYDKKDLPSDIEKLAVLAGVKFSEFQRFKQVFEQVLKHKFNQNENGRLENNYAKTILQKREVFKDKREKSGNIGVVIKLAKSIKGFTDKHLTTLKDSLYDLSIEEIEKHKDKQVLEQMLKLYINGNKNEDIIIHKNKNDMYGVNQNIILSIPEYEKLKVDFGEKKTKQAIDYLSDWGIEKPAKFKEYKDHNKTLRRWVFDAIEKKPNYTDTKKSNLDRNVLTD